MGNTQHRKKKKTVRNIESVDRITKIISFKKIYIV